MKRLFWIIIGIIFSLSLTVSAEEYQDKFDEVRYINDYVVKSKNGIKKYQQMTMMERLSDGEFVYCIEPGIAINSDNLLVGSDMNQSEFASISKDEWKRISLLAYYGYGYSDHTNIKWYTITQFMIWQTVNNGYDIYFTDTLNGKRITKYTSEMKEMEDLLSKHNIVPDFGVSSINLKLDESATLIDNNQVLEMYDVAINDLVNIQKSTNSLTLTALKAGSNSITLTKKDKTLEHPAIVYVHPVSQDIVVRGSYDEINVKIGVTVENIAKVKVTKIDKVTKEIIKLSDIKFKIKNINTNEYICENISCEFSTNADGSFVTSSNLGHGKYILEEVNQRIDGYLWNSVPLEFEISNDSNLIRTDNGLLLELFYENEPVKTKVEIEKFGEEVVINDGNYSYKEVLLDGVSFKLFAGSDIINNGNILYKDNEFIKEFKTINGRFILEDLPLGKYYILESETVNGHVKDDVKHYFELNYIDQYTNIVNNNIKLKNYLPKGKLEFNKLDDETKEKLSDTKMEVYTCDDILIYSGFTNNDGKIILDDLFLGNFYIIETEAKDGYQLSSERQYFEISENGEIVNVNKTNNKIVIPVPRTDTYDYIVRCGFILFSLGLMNIIYGNFYKEKHIL